MSARSFQGFAPSAFRLLKDLRAHNERAWFHAHKEQIEAEVLTPFGHMLEAVSERLEKAPLPLSGGRKTMFRMQRDVRFAKDESPYKTNVGGLLTPTGKKIETTALVYCHLEDSGGFVAAGFYQLPTRALARIREAIIDDAVAFTSIVEQLGKKDLEMSRQDSLSGMPRGFSEAKDHPLAPFLKLKSLIVRAELPKACFRDGTVVDRVSAHAEACMPLLFFGREAL